jgi:hypothetical protein
VVGRPNVIHVRQGDQHLVGVHKKTAQGAVFNEFEVCQDDSF